MENRQLSLFDIAAPKVEDSRDKEFYGIIKEGFRLLKIAKDSIRLMQEYKAK